MTRATPASDRYEVRIVKAPAPVQALRFAAALVLNLFSEASGPSNPRRPAS